MRHGIRALALVGMLSSIAGCGKSADHPNGPDGAAPASGGADGASGGVNSGGGALAASGGASAYASGGASATGGASSSGGRSAGATGGASSEPDGSPPAPDAGVGALPGWKLVFHDEFDGPSGASPNAAFWNFETGGNGWGNQELEYYTARTDNAALDGNGALVITARKEQYMGNAYTSARMTTQGKFDQAYGRFEARIRIPKGQGLWPAFWMLGNDIGTAGWPQCGETDVMENIGKEPSIAHGTIHGPNYSNGTSYTLPGGAKFADAYHVFAVEWEAASIRFYVDGSLYGTHVPGDLPQNAKWVYDHPNFILLNVAVGGQWPGNPDATTVFPQHMDVDYVRVYTKAP